MTDRRSAAVGIDLLVVVALRAELKGIARELGLRKRRHRYVDAAGGLLAACVGPGRSAGPGTRKLVVEAQPTRVLHVGYCGGLDASLEAGDAVRVGKAVNDATGEALDLDAGEAVLVTTGEPALTPDAKRRLAERWNAAAVDTESFHVASACREAGVPCSVVKAVTDTADEGLDAAVVRLVDDTGRTRGWRVARLLVTRPRLISTLRQLAARSRNADRRLVEHVKMHGDLP